MGLAHSPCFGSGERAGRAYGCGIAVWAQAELLRQKNPFHRNFETPILPSHFCRQVDRGKAFFNDSWFLIVL
jgi:hypothetical protein